MKKQILIIGLITILLVSVVVSVTLTFKPYIPTEKDTLNDIPTNIQQMQKDYPDSVVIKFIPVPTGKLINKTVIFKGKEIILKNAPEYKKVANYSVKYDKLSLHLMEENIKLNARLDAAGIKS